MNLSSGNPRQVNFNVTFTVDQTVRIIFVNQLCYFHFINAIYYINILPKLRGNSVERIETSFQPLANFESKASLKICDTLSDLFQGSGIQLHWQICRLPACLLITNSIWLYRSHTAIQKCQSHKNWGRFQPLFNPKSKASLNCVTNRQNYSNSRILNYIY
jgi:hypothetical protein